MCFLLPPREIRPAGCMSCMIWVCGFPPIYHQIISLYGIYPSYTLIPSLVCSRKQKIAQKCIWNEIVAMRLSDIYLIISMSCKKSKIQATPSPFFQGIMNVDVFTSYQTVALVFCFLSSSAPMYMQHRKPMKKKMRV